MFEAIIDPWTWGDFMWRGVLSSALVAIPCAIIGVFLYLRRMSMIADALAHVALPGVVIAFLISGTFEGPSLFIGALVAGLLAAWLIETLQKRSKVRSDASIGIVFTSFFALGIIALSVFVKDAHLDLDCVLYGNVLGVSNNSLMTLGITAPFVVGVAAVLYRWLTVATFDPSFALTAGVPVAGVQYALTAMASTTAVAGFESVGAILVVAFIIVPAATAHLLSNSMGAMMKISVLVGVGSSVFGMYVAALLDCAPAGAIVVTMASVYMVVFVFAPVNGFVARLFAERRLLTLPSYGSELPKAGE